MAMPNQERVEVVDSDGQLLGDFTPFRVQKTPDHILSMIDHAEIERRRQLPSDGDVLNSQVLEWLKLLGAEIDRRAAAREPSFSTEGAMAYFRSLREAYFQRNGTPKG